MRAVDIGGRPNAVSDIDAQIVEMRTKIAKAFTSYRAECIEIQNETERWNQKFRSLQNGSYCVLRLMVRACAFADRCQALADRLGCSAYICQDVEAVLAAQTLRSDGAIIVLDLVEPPSYRLRWDSLDGPLDPLVHAHDRAISGLMSLADVVLVTSATLGAELQKTGLQTILMRDDADIDRATRELEWSGNEAALMTQLRGAGAVAMLRTERPVNEQRSRQIVSTLLSHGVDLTIVTAHPKVENDNVDRPGAQIAGAKYIEIPVDN
ncbi:MAG: hypothetical protein WA459_13800 [Stellaceae bacterium]